MFNPAIKLSPISSPDLGFSFSMDINLYAGLWQALFSHKQLEKLIPVEVTDSNFIFSDKDIVVIK